MVELSERVDKYIDIEEFLKMKDPGFVDDESLRAKWKYKGFEKGSGKKPRQNQQKGSRDQAPMAFTPLFCPIQKVINVVESQNLLKKPAKLKSPPEKKNRDKYC